MRRVDDEMGAVLQRMLFPLVKFQMGAVGVIDDYRKSVFFSDSHYRAVIGNFSVIIGRGQKTVLASPSLHALSSAFALMQLAQPSSSSLSGYTHTGVISKRAIARTVEIWHALSI